MRMETLTLTLALALTLTLTLTLKGLGFRGLHRIEDFAAWAAKRNESTIIVAGHSLW